MRYIIFIFLMISFSLTIAQTTTIPDVNFEQNLIDLGIDTNGLNGNILNSDAQAVTNLNISVNTITDFTGLEAFINITSLDLGNNQFATVPLNTLMLLEELNFSNYSLATLDLSQNTSLRVLSIEASVSTLNGIPSITTLDLSNNTNLEQISILYFRNLSDLIFPITATLNQIFISFLADSTLDFSILDGLSNLDINNSEVNTNITLPNETSNLEHLRITSINIATIDVSNYINLTRKIHKKSSKLGVKVLFLRC